MPTTVENCFNRWAKARVIATHVKAPPTSRRRLKSADDTLGRTRRGLTTQITAPGGRIPDQRNRKVPRCVDPRLYRQRNLIEWFFNPLKSFRKAASRHKRTARNDLSTSLAAFGAPS